MGTIHSKLLSPIPDKVTQRVFRKFGDPGAFQPQSGDSNGHIELGSSRVDIETLSLFQPLEVRR
jgi:hypothetical protein